MKILEENPEINLHDLEFDRRVLMLHQKGMSNRREVDKLDVIKVQNFCASEGITKKVKR